MGLLDDAIREHLDLKRRRGADPGEVAREQREALDPVPRRGQEQPPGYSVVDDDPPSGEALSEGLAGGDGGGVEPPAGVEQAHSDPDDPASEDHPYAQSTRDADFSNVGQETDELDMRTVLEEPPSGETAEGAEDVLEETPDFLRDTPEQERLWFEQRPPRDFDFDK